MSPTPATGTLPPASPVGTVDWQRLARESWGREPARLSAPGRPPVCPRHCFGTMRTASAPFRTGTRFKATPDVRFLTTAGLLRAPGPLLPDVADPDIESYLDRVRTGCDQPGWLLVVDQPLVVDFPLWAAVRDLVEGLWRRVGWPVLPVRAELAAGHGYLRTTGVSLPPTAAGLLWVLAGELTLRLWRTPGTGGADPRRPDLEMSGTAGDLLYWPAGFRHAELFGDRCLTLKLAIDAEHRELARIVRTLLIDLAQANPRYADGTVPYLPYEPSLNPDGSTPTAGPLDEIAAEVHRITGGTDLARGLLRQWAVRRSAAGLEPVPPPSAEQSRLGPHDRIRVTSPIIRLPDGAGRALWAVNGHLLPVAGAAGDRIRAALPVGTEIGVGELSRAVGAGEDSEAVLALLRPLHRLQAIAPVAYERS